MALSKNLSALHYDNVVRHVDTRLRAQGAHDTKFSKNF